MKTKLMNIAREVSKAKGEEAVGEIALMDAALAGATIEFRAKETTPEKWYTSGDPGNLGWYFNEWEYRIKEEPYARFFVRYANGYVSASNFSTEQQARDWAVATDYATIIKLVEVTS